MPVLGLSVLISKMRIRKPTSVNETWESELLLWGRVLRGQELSHSIGVGAEASGFLATKLLHPRVFALAVSVA